MIQIFPKAKNIITIFSKHKNAVYVKIIFLVQTIIPNVCVKMKRI